MRASIRFAAALVVALVAVLAWQGTASAATAIEYGLIAAMV